MDDRPLELTTKEVAAFAGVSYRQVDYWTRIGMLDPSIVSAYGSGSRRRWSVADARLVWACGQADHMEQRWRITQALIENPGTRLVILDDGTAMTLVLDMDFCPDVAVVVRALRLADRLEPAPA